MLNALNTTDKLDPPYKRGRTSAEFILAETSIEGIFVNLHKKLTRGDPRSDLFANTFEAYQQTAVAMVAKERGRAGHPDRVNTSSESSRKRCSQTSFRAI